MSSDPKHLLEVILIGNGLALNLGGGKRQTCIPLEKRGYRYFKIDVCSYGKDEPTIKGDTPTLPFQDETFDLVISKDSLEHFHMPCVEVKEVKE